MRGSLKVGVEAQCHRGTVGGIVSRSSSVYVRVRTIVIVREIIKQCNVENLQEMIIGCFGD